MELFLIWLGLSIVAGMWAQQKGRSGVGYFLLSVLASPLIGLIAAGVATRDDGSVERRMLSAGTHRQCPECAELVRREARKCRFCGASLNVPVVTEEVHQVPPPRRQTPSPRDTHARSIER